MTPEQRFWAKVEQVDDGCWEWRGKRINGYGSHYFEGRVRKAHRIAYALVKGAVPVGLDLDHLCRNRACCNPDHLEPVTRQENLLRSPLTLTARNAAKTHCPLDHEYTPENTYVRPRSGQRTCRICQRRRQAERARRLSVSA